MDNSGSDFLTCILLVFIILILACVSWCTEEPTYKRAEWG